jgi:type VI secretion system protein ImpF
MAELTPLEKLQPCLLDRLTDDDPGNREESRSQRVVSVQRYRRGVLRDMEWLFNASAHLPNEGGGRFQLRDFPESCRSTINYGTRQLCGLLAPNMEDLESELAAAIQFFEPRILPRSLEVKAFLERQTIAFEIRGEIWANPIPEQLFIRTKIDLETGQCVTGDMGNGRTAPQSL